MIKKACKGFSIPKSVPFNVCLMQLIKIDYRFYHAIYMTRFHPNNID